MDNLFFQVGEIIQNANIARAAVTAGRPRARFREQLKLAILNTQDAQALSEFSENRDQLVEDLARIERALDDIEAAGRKITLQQKAEDELSKTIRELRDIKASVDVERTRRMVNCLLGTPGV